MNILDGKKVQNEKLEALKDRVAFFDMPPRLVIVDIGGGEEAKVYVNQKKKFGESIGVEVIHKIFREEPETEIISYIEEMNEKEDVRGIIVQLPMRGEYNEKNILDAIVPQKDIDGLSTANREALYGGNTPSFVPATARGVIELLAEYHVLFTGRACVIGESHLTGKPLAELLRRKGMEVVMANEYSENIPAKAKECGLLVSATGVPHLVDASFVNENQWVVDVGFAIQTIEGEAKIAGDVKFDEVKDIVSRITPVPGGVGPMTVLALFENLLGVPFEM